MKKILKIVLWLVGIVVVFIAAGLGYVKMGLPSVPLTEVKVDPKPERIAHGEYLANHVALCMDCHSRRDWAKFSGPIVPGTFAGGGEMFTEEFGFPGTYVSRNISPAGIGQWTDAELYRAITSGVSRNGHALFPVMPYPNYGQVDKEDILDIMAYIRSLPAVQNEPQPSSSNFPMNFIINTIPAPAKDVKKPAEADKVAYGQYTLTMAGCSECHTAVDDKAQPLPGMHMGGGREFTVPWGTLRSPNLTPDPNTGIGNWTEEQFVKTFKAYADSSYKPAQIAAGGYNTIMPWIMYSGMKDSDLKAIYAYLRSLPPVHNKVVRYVPAGQQAMAE